MSAELVGRQRAFRRPSHSCPLRGGEPHRLARDLVLRGGTALRYLLDGAAILIARREVHGGVDAGRIRPQGRVDDAHGLDEGPPVRRPEEPKAADAVADRDLVLGLALADGLEDVLDGLAAFGEPLLEPRHGKHQRAALALQARRELRDERGRQRRIRVDHLREHGDHPRGRIRRGLEHPLDPVFGGLAIGASSRHGRDDSAQALDERQPKHDRDGPQLSEAQRRDRLIRGDEGAQAVDVDAALGVRDQLEDDIVDPGHPAGARVGEPGQLAVVSPRQVPSRRSDLLLDDVIVVDEPLRGRSDAGSFSGDARDEVVRLSKRDGVGGQPRQQRVRPPRPLRGQAVPRGERPRVLLELTDAEELGGARREVVAVAVRGTLPRSTDHVADPHGDGAHLFTRLGSTGTDDGASSPPMRECF